MQADSDATLMQRVVGGDEAAFAEIVGRYKNPLVNYLTHLVRSRERAEEVAQDAFVRLYRNASKYREQERLGPYLYRIATNLVVTDVRREKRWSLLLPRLHASTNLTVTQPDAGLFVDEIQKKVSAALERLPVKYRAPIVLCDIEEWSYEEIARALECRVGTVKSRIFRGREMLRRQLAPYMEPHRTGDRNDRNERHTVDAIAAQTPAHERVASLRL
jgi:RNA polymerase sigma-70 factor (ECF subfamily)